MYLSDTYLPTCFICIFNMKKNYSYKILTLINHLLIILCPPPPTGLLTL